MTDNINKILEFTPTWVQSNDLFRKVGGNKATFTKKVKKAESDGYIDMKSDGNKKFYKRNDNGDSELGFASIMKVNEDNQKVELDEIKRLTTIGYIKDDEKILTDEGKELLDHVQSEVDRAYMVIVRMNYQANLKVINQRTANERTERLQRHIDKIMKALTSKYNKDLIKDYFQNHIKNLEFKI